MHTLLAARQGLTLIDAAMKRILSRTKLNASEAWVLMAVGVRVRVLAVRVARDLGWTRQQAHRSLGVLRAGLLVEPSGVCADGRLWRLTPLGAKKFARLKRVLDAYERHVCRLFNPEMFVEFIGRMVLGFVNRRNANGWAKGIYEPVETIERVDVSCCACDGCGCRCHKRPVPLT